MNFSRLISNRAFVAIVWLPLSVSVFLGTSCSETGTRVSESGSVTTTGGVLPNLIRARNERKRGPLPESEWNKHGVWKKIRNHPPTYIPSGLSNNFPRTDEEGQWFVDVRKEADGKRLFVPNYMKGPRSSTVLGVEAKAIVNWRYSKGEKWYRNVDHRQ